MPRESWERHPDEDALERYAMDQAEAEELQAVEEHLLICAECQDGMERIETWLKDFRGAALNACAFITVVHATDAGPVYLHAEACGEGQWKASFRGRDLEGADVFPGRAAAFRYLRRSFAEMFPGHRCGSACRIEDCRPAPDTP